LWRAVVAVIQMAELFVQVQILVESSSYTDSRISELDRDRECHIFLGDHVVMETRLG
jgi:hypothetical protein